MEEVNFNLDDVEIVDSVSYSGNNIIVRVSESGHGQEASVSKDTAKEDLPLRPIDDIASMDVHEYVNGAKNPNTRSAENLVGTKRFFYV